MVFNPNHIDPLLLRKQSYNLRWAEVSSDVIPLTAADLDLPVAQPITDAIIEFSKKGCFNYGPAFGWPALKACYARYFLNKRDIHISPEHILPVDSAAFGISLVCDTILKSGDEAIILDPVDFLFRHGVEKAGASAIPFSISPVNGVVDFSKMEELINSRTRLICLCNPVNPTGKVFSRSELISLLEIACKHDLIILSDEIWSDIVFEPNPFVSIGSIHESIHSNVVIVTGMSKSYGLAGLRIGAVLTGNVALFDELKQHSGHQSTVHGVNILSQIAAVAALDQCEDWLQAFKNHLQQQRDFCVGFLNGLPGFSCIAPQGTYVAFVDISGTGMSSMEMQSFLLNQAKVAVVPGLPEWFGAGAEGYIRISFATSKPILEEAMHRIQSVF